MTDADPWLDSIPPDELLEIACPDVPAEAPLPDSAPIGALRQWRDEVNAKLYGQHPDRPSTWKHDALYVAATWELAGSEAKRAGLPRAAATYFERAALAIAEAVAERAA